MFITTFKTARYLSLSWARSIQSMLPSNFSKIHFNIIFHLRLGLPSALLSSGFPSKTLYAPLLSQYVLHALSISVFLTWSPKRYLMKSTDHKAPFYVVFSTLLLPRPSKAQISSSVPNSRKPSAYIPPSMWAIKPQTIQNNRQIIILYIYIFTLLSKKL